jgi:hypothetical protein
MPCSSPWWAGSAMCASIRPLSAVQAHTGQLRARRIGHRRPALLRGDATGVVALEFRNPDGTYFVHGAVIDAFEDGRNPEVAYFIVHNARLDDNWFFRAHRVSCSIRAPSNVTWKIMPCRPRARPGFLAPGRLPLPPAQPPGAVERLLPAKIVKGLAFSPLTDIRALLCKTTCSMNTWWM